jgi:hypothetical protein
MNCIREAENYLRYYRELHQSIEHADYMISKLVNQTAPKEVSAVSMDVTGVRAGKPCNTLNQMYQLQMWQEMKNRTLVEIEKVDNVLVSISKDPGCERYKDILYMWYVKKKAKEEIADEIGYSHRQSVYEIRSKAIKKFAVALFGVVALVAI